MDTRLVTPTSTDPLVWAVAAIRDPVRDDAYRLYQDYVDGVQRLQFATSKYETAFGALFEAFAYNRCVVPETPVWTRSGVRAAGAVNPGDVVLGHDGLWHTVTDARVIPTDEALVRVVPQCGPALTVTADHPLLVTKRDRLRTITGKYATGSHVRIAKTGRNVAFHRDSLSREWVPAGRLAPGDLVWGAIPVGGGPTPEGVTAEHIRLLGWYLAEGSVSKIGRVVFSLHREECDAAREIGALLSSCFGARSVVQPDRPDSAGVGVVTYDKGAAAWLCRWGGKGCAAKAVHPDLFFSGADLTPLLAAAWSGDGTTMAGRFSATGYTTVSLSLAAQIHALLLRQGIAATWRECQPVGKRRAYSFSVGGEHARRLANIVGDDVGRSAWDKAPNGAFLDGLFVCAITAVEPASPSGEVVALTVDGSASYTHPGSISSHNCGAVVDAFADRLHVEGWKADDAATEQRANELWAANGMDRRQGEVYQESLTAGDAPVLVWPDFARDEPTFWPQTARQIRIRRDDDDPTRIAAAVKAWVLADGRTRLTLYLPDEVRRYVTRTKRTLGTALTVAALAPYEDDAPAVAPNPWGVVPLVPFANNARTGQPGRSELADVVPLQDSLNKTLTDMVVAMELAAYPQRVLIGLDIDRNPETGEAIQKFQSGIARILALADEKIKLAEFQAVALKQFVDVAEFWDTAISRASRVPVHYLRMTGDFPSGRALRTAEAPFVAKLEDRQRAFGADWATAMALALTQDGVSPEKARTVAPVWRSAAPMGAEETWELAMQKRGVGISLFDVLVGMGVAPDEATAQVERARAEREDAAGGTADVLGRAVASGTL